MVGGEDGRGPGSGLPSRIRHDEQVRYGAIQKAANDAGYMMLWKRKRKIGSIAHPHYRRFGKQLEFAENVIIVDSGISANRVIEASTAVISMPFTSTALIARELGRPSCYYDPTGLVQRDDRAAHGIDVIRNPEELTSWLNGITNMYREPGLRVGEVS